mmetsp:Transcript_36732/g.77076  ORF Transcript_36732/g.77076 Transcript_36732/m.77076 type:complete len:207 (-) Transcript_36732:1576-2196(-)
MHPAPSRRRHERRQARQRGGRRDRQGNQKPRLGRRTRRIGWDGRLLHPLRGSDERAHRYQVHDGRRAVARIAARSRSQQVQRDHHGRSARTQPQHGRPLRRSTKGGGATVRPQAHRDQRDVERRRLFGLLRGSARLSHPGTHVPRRDLLRQGSAGGLRHGGRQADAADSFQQSAGRYFDIHDGAGGHRGDMHGPRRKNEQSGRGWG